MKKRNILKFNLGIILVLFILNSCDKVLDVVPSDKVSIDRLLNKSTTVSKFIVNCYSQLNTSFVDQSSGQLLDVFTDDAFRAGTGTFADWHAALLTPANSMFANSIWNSNWEGIRSCNLAIKYLPKSVVSKDVIDDEQIAIWINEAKLLRAWYHFNLIQNFGPIPLIEEPFSPDFVDWPLLNRPTYDEIASRIAKECDDVITSGKIPLRWNGSADFDRVNLAFAYALKSRVLLYNASLLNNPNNDQTKWQKAATAAQSCLTAVGAQYSLVPMAQYENLFNQDVAVANSEIILRSTENSAAALNNNNGVDLKGLGSTTQSSNCGAVPSQELVDCFELTDGTLPVTGYANADHTSVIFGGTYNENAGANPYLGRDARLKSDIVFNTTTYGKYKGQAVSAPELVIYTYLGKTFTGFNTNTISQLETDKRLSCTGYYMRKFRSSSYWGSTAGGTFSNKIYFRLAEIYLNLAEANCELNNLDDAMDALDKVRVRAEQPKISDVPGFVKTKDFLMNRIRNERRVEFCFEEHRFYDQRRWKILDQTNGVISGMKITSAGTTNKDLGPFSYERVKIETVRNATSDKYLVLPIPQDEARKLTGIGQPEAWQ